MATLAKLVVKLVTDVSEFTSGLDSASKKLTKVGDDMVKVGNKMTIGVTAPLMAAGTMAIKMASDLDEARNKANVVFADMADDVRKFAQASADSLGMSEAASLGYTSTFGAMLKNMGLAPELVSEMSMELTKLVADYASFHNLSPGEAFDKIKAGLVGSAEPLLALGKNLRMSEVGAYAMANGIATSADSMTNAELALARYGLLLAQSADEMGDFERTSDGLANSTRTLRAQFENMMASFGEVALPAATELINALIPILKWFNELPPSVKTGIVYVLMFAAALGPLLTLGGNVAKVLGWITKAFGAKTVAASTAAAATGKLGFSFAGLAAKIGLAGKGLGVILTTIGAAVGPFLALALAAIALGAVLAFYGEDFLNTIKIIYNGFINVIGALFKLVFEKFKSFREQGKSWMTSIVYGMISGLAAAANAFWQALLMTVFKPFVIVIEQIKKLLKMSSPSKVFAGIGMNMMLGLAEGIEKYAPKSIDANINAVNDLSAVSAGGIKSGGRGASISIGEIRIQGDLSESAKISLRKEIRNIFGQELKAVME
jgi:hypothetical protein